MEDNVKATVWKIPLDNNKHHYRIQIEGTTKRTKRKVLESLQDWSEVGHGCNKGKHFILLFAKSFKDEKTWKKWVQSFPYELDEMNRNGKKKKINKNFKEA